MHQYINAPMPHCMWSDIQTTENKNLKIVLPLTSETNKKVGGVAY